MSLSDKISLIHRGLDVRNVKEFIKELKEGMMCTDRDLEIIDKLAGEGLI